MPFITKGETNVKYLLVVTFFAVTAIAGVFYYSQWMTRESENILQKNQTACTEEAKICPDGSAVGRTGPNCEFVLCPNINKVEGGSGFACGTDTVFGAGGLTYGTVLGPDGKCWLDRNLGATQVAVSATDVNAYGYYYQWGRGNDGHQVPSSATTSTNADSDTPGHANFITENASPFDWRVPQSPNELNLWAGTKLNNVCPADWHVPTSAEWETVSGYFSPQTSVGAFNSVLKLPLAGYRDHIDAALYGRGRDGSYWSSSPSGTYASYLYFDSGGVDPASTGDRAYGFSVRCVKD